MKEETPAIFEAALVETHSLAGWVPTTFRVIETAQTREAFDAGHIPGSVFWPLSELFTPDFRLRTDPARFGALLSRSGITPDTLAVCSFGGDPVMAGWAAWLFWILTSFGHVKTFVLNGGTPRWRSEGRLTARLEPEPEPTVYPLPPAFSESQRATLAHVRGAVERSLSGGDAAALLDARTTAEFRGEHFFDAPPRPGERAGHIPSARHLPHSALLQKDGTYRPAEELRAFCEQVGLDAGHEMITYCALGIRSALVWFLLRRLLDFPHVRNYDGSWNEWSRAEAGPGEDRPQEAL